MQHQLIQVHADKVILEGMLQTPPGACGLVLFAHGSGSSRFSPRNNFVARVLNEGRLASLLIDLLTKEEDEVYETRFDTSLLARRLALVLDWIKVQPKEGSLPIGLFGSSTGAAAALKLAAMRPDGVKAVVSRGGRPDLAWDSLASVQAPTLFIVGENDMGVIELNEKAFKKLICVKETIIIPHATHLFEEEGCLEQVASYAQEWFIKYLVV